MTRLFRHCLALALLCAAPAALAPAVAGAQEIQRPAAGDERAIVDTIRAQLDAFQADDWPRAFSYATPRLRELFGTVENFTAMVRGGYQPVYRPRSVEFLDARIIDGKTGQAVRFVGPDGQAVIALYTMERQPDGGWRIAAVQLVRTGEVSS
ncbi:DUF4864 domain-containing protein [Pelagibius sp. CAU 1746]|uniref:DUF4864 domain-containing protein n=1 Tax=Pelagibius sp. CAU 1746 TaxID=3140370 RepID=UPI00325BC702